MTGAMYAAIAGLKAHMSKLNVISNNVANVNTYGYKSQRAVFSDALYTTQTTGSNGTQTAGGRNPSQIGYGTQMTSVDIDMSTGTYAPTGKDMDCMIYGDGFFLVGDKEKAQVIDPNDPSTLKSLTLTRVGDIDFRADGYLADHNGSVVYGFECIGTVDDEPIFSDQLVPLRLPKAKTVIEQVNVYDKDGNLVTDANGDPVTEPKQTIEICYPKFNKDSGRLEDVTDAGKDLPKLELDSISIDPATGRITGTTKDTDEVITVGVIAVGNVTNPNGVSHVNGPYYKARDGAGDLTVSVLGGIGGEMYVTGKNLEDLAEKDNNGAVIKEPTLDNAEISKGLTSVNYSMLVNKIRGDDGNIPADATMPVALEGMRVGNGGASEFITNGLEASKADLATEISEMITTQRGYQANTRIVTVTDSMLEELVNMKR